MENLVKEYSNDLEKFFYENESNLIHKWLHYFEIYDRHFSRFRGKDCVLVEIGVSHGGSLKMWQKYFGPNVKIYGIDIDKKCQKFSGGNIEIILGSQSDPKFLEELKRKIPRIDILIDDGGHYMDQQRITFNRLYNHISENGVYLIEDLHTSYWKEYGGGYRHKDSFIEFAKGFIDKLNAFHSRHPRLKVDEFTRTTHSLHAYDSVVVLEKRKIIKPTHEMRGIKSF